MKKIAIMQPTFFPWIGYFDIMDQCEVFVLLDSVQFEKRSWQQRNRIKTPDGPLMITIPVLSKGRFNQKISEVSIEDSGNFFEKTLKTIYHNYKKSRFINHYFDELSGLFNRKHRFLSEFTIEIIEWLKSKFGITTKLILSTSLELTGKKEELLVNICNKLGFKHYLSTPGSEAYIMKSRLFELNDISVEYHKYVHPAYSQLYGDFIPFMSSLDLLFNEGNRSLEIIRSGREK